MTLPKKKKYTSWRCKDCEIDYFVTSAVTHTTHCPQCGDNLFTESIKVVWLERPFNYKRPWSEEEREIIESGLHLGKTYREISQELDGRTENAVRRQIQQLRSKGMLSI